MEVLVRVDGKGRLVIPKELRERLGIHGLVRLRVEGDKLIVEPIRDPLEALEASVIEGTRDVAREIGGLRRSAFEEAARRLAERWA